VLDFSEDQLLTLAQAGNEAAFAELMRRTFTLSFRLAFSILKDREDTEDELQHSYWSAWRNLRLFQRDSKFSTWMSRIVINRCLMRLRKTGRVRFLHLDDGAPDGEVPVMELRDKRLGPEAEFSRSEMYALLHKEIRRLPPLLRHTLVMRDLDELPMDYVAGQLGISLVAAKSRLMRARLELRHRLDLSRHRATIGSKARR